MGRLEFVDETNVSISISKSELSALDGTLGWIGLVGFGVDGESNAFTFKVDAKQARAELMRKTLPWLIPLIVVVVVAVVVIIIVIVVCRHRKLVQKEPKADEMTNDTFPVEEEKMEENEGTHDALRNQRILTTAGNAIKEENNTAKAEEVPETLPTTLNVVEALLCQGKIQMTVVREEDTLYNALHVREQKRSIVKRVTVGRTVEEFVTRHVKPETVELHFSSKIKKVSNLRLSHVSTFDYLSKFSVKIPYKDLCVIVGHILQLSS
ncbi:hypothetical protein BLNAU_5275 [Blattamonas nauphoetae]|uniref:Uncharacterized protein n=1 Tax=Blattamonas nauphoetae TaxID=2049346 RepID=A0ABQ9Y7Q2_9EUKA|nr:hypothetical protein BLNAU_5275 [Blattamonas nauphoetae]